jgi:hypothetical protein
MHPVQRVGHGVAWLIGQGQVKDQQVGAVLQAGLDASGGRSAVLTTASPGWVCSMPTSNCKNIRWSSTTTQVSGARALGLVAFIAAEPRYGTPSRPSAQLSSCALVAVLAQGQHHREAGSAQLARALDRLFWVWEVGINLIRIDLMEHRFAATG